MAKIEGILTQEFVSSNSHEATQLYEKSRFGEKKQGKIVYMLEEAMYLVATGKMNVLAASYKKLSNDELMKKLSRMNTRFLIRFSVYSDLRKKGYTVKSALKFGGDFRVYEKGKNIGNSHSKWICFCESEHKTFSAQDFSAKNRVAHSTKKSLLFAIVDSENDVTYYESSWKKVV